MARAWLFQDHRQKQKLGRKCPWSVGWLDARGKRRSKRVGNKKQADRLRKKIESQLTTLELLQHDDIVVETLAQEVASQLLQQPQFTQEVTRQILLIAIDRGADALKKYLSQSSLDGQ